MRYAMSASALALCLAIGLPAQAQQPVAQPAPAPGAKQQQQASQFDMSRFNQMLEQAGVEQRQEFQGKLVRAQTSDGHPFFMIVGPENLAGGESIDTGTDQIRNALQKADLQRIQPVDNAVMVRGRMEGKGVLALSGQQGWEGQPGQPTQELRQDAVEQALEQAGIEDREEFQGSLIRARTSGGNTVFLIVGPENMAGGESVEINKDQIRQSLQRAGMQDVQVIEDGTHLVRGAMEESAVLAVAGNFIEPPRAGMGAGGAPQPGQPGMKQPQPGMPRQK